MSSHSTVEFLSRLSRLGVKVSADGNRLLINAPPGAVTPESRNELSEHKAEILEFLKEASEATLPAPAPIKRAARDREIPLSFSQMRLWLLDRLEPGSPAYNIQTQFSLTGDLNLEALERALSEIVRRHEVLRTYFATVNGQRVQKIAPPEPFRISVIELNGSTAEECYNEASPLALMDAKTPFDLERAPLIRATLFRGSSRNHLILFNVHHIVFDEWSQGVFQQEFSQLYKASVQGQASPLPDLPVQYADFALWQRNWLQGEVLERQLHYWKETLKGPLPILDLPTDRPRPSLQTHNGANAVLATSSGLRDRLNQLSRREGVTLFITLMAAFEVLLMRYTGQEDVLVGTPFANRSRAELEGLIGFFANTLVMRTDLSGDPTFRELLKRVQDTALGANAHEDLPFERLVQELNPERDLSRSPIFQAMFSFLNTPTTPVELPGLEVKRVGAEVGASKVDLGLYAMESPAGIYCAFEYNTDLFNSDRIERFARHFEALLEDVTQNPDRRLSELSILTAAERRQVLVDWNQTRVEFPKDQTLHRLFELQAQQTPESVALEFKGRPLRYRELNERANHLAWHLKALGVGPDSLVGLLHERSENMMVALLGILKAGGAYVPLDPYFPKDRLNYMIEDSGMRVLITQSTLDGMLSKRPESVVRLDTDWTEIARHPNDSGPDVGVSAQNLAYVLYTSGSTGRPKGVEIEHAAVVNLLRSVQQEPGFTAADTMVAVTTLSFDIAGLELYLPLICGGRLVIASREDSLDPARLMKLIGESRCTVMQATPATWRAMIHARWKGSPKLKALCGGEGFSPEFAEKLRSRCGELWNMYGPTETTIWSTVGRITEEKAAISIGRPIANTQVYVLDRNRNPVPVGVNGELYIGGTGLARGYLNRPELTDEKFLPSPFDAAKRVYRTGDLARWWPDGQLECLGRIDNQVKIRGFRIELEEIEGILSRHPAIQQCAVVAANDSTGDRKLVAYYEVHGDAPPAVNELREHLKHTLPDYMIPTGWVAVPTLPLTPNNKVDRKALPLLGQLETSQMGSSHAPRRTETERRLAKIWEEVLEVQQIGVHDNFFDLGGHSLSALNLIDEVEREFGIQFPLIQLFHAPTISEFSEVLEREQFSRGRNLDGLDTATIAQQVRQFIVENYLGGQSDGLEDSDSFLERRVIDPIRLYELVEFLEQTYGVSIDHDSVAGANLDSIDQISRFVFNRVEHTGDVELPEVEKVKQNHVCKY
ncbi:MAG: amino acid adenylation domain-containing protein [Candidatus Acidiferrales bacterium]